MTTAERIINRCPRFYKSWDKSSILSLLIEALSVELEQADMAIADILNAHWVDTASGMELDNLGKFVGISRGVGEDDAKFRLHLKRAVDEYRGGGTLVAIKTELYALLLKEELEIIENPEANSVADFTKTANETWSLGSLSIQDELAALSLTVLDDGTVTNPKITNTDTQQEIMFQGQLKTDDQLIIKDGRAFLNGEDVSEKVTSLEIKLLRKGSQWRYSEALLDSIGIFDKSRFNKNIFSINIPRVKIHYEWVRRRPATFLVNIKAQALSRSGITPDQLSERLGSLRAAGVKVIIKVTE